MADPTTLITPAPKTDTIWLAVFVVPPQDHPLAVQGSPLIGYDVWTGTLFPDEGAVWPGFTSSQVNRIRALPRPYGVHITVGDALEYPATVLPEVASRLEGIAAQVAPFVLKGASYDQHYWDTVLALRWEAGINDLHRLAVASAVHINTLRHRLNRVTVPMTTQPHLLRDWAIETVFGRHWTIEKYYPHLTLGNALENQAERDRLWATWQRSGYLSQDMGEYDLPVDRLYLMTLTRENRFWGIHPDYPDGFPLQG